MSRLEAVREREERFVLGTYARAPLCVSHGEGAWVWDLEGKRYLDLVSGIAVNALGHSDPAVVAAIHEQASRLIHCSNLYYFEGIGRMAEILCTRSGLARAFFSNSGTEANEGAIKFVRKYWYENGSAWRHEIVTIQDSFHGRTYGGMAATGQDKIQAGFGSMLPGFVRAELTAESLRENIGAHTAAVLIEPILAEGGVIEPPPAFWAELQALREKHKFLLVFDEIQTGLGRTGDWFGFQATGLVPDLVTLAKPLGGGLPLGAVLVAEALLPAIHAGDHGSTFGGNPVAVAAGLAVLDRLASVGFLENVCEVSAHLQAGLAALCTPQGPFLEVRGRGMLIGVRLSVDPGKVINAARDAGLIVHRAGSDVLRLLPPLVLTREQVDLAVSILARVASEL